MKKSKFKVALFSLVATVGVTFATNDIIPTLRLSPIEGSVIVVQPETAFGITILYSKTNELFYSTNNEFDRIPINIAAETKNTEEEQSHMFIGAINDAGVENTYDFFAYSVDGNMVRDHIVYKTQSNPEL